jgi:hypothetical protein
MACFPGITAAAIFVALVLTDLYKRDWHRVPGHALFGVFIVLLLLFICERIGEGPAWLLLMAPFAFVFLGMFFSSVFRFGKIEKVHHRHMNDKCGCCNMNPCRCRTPCMAPPPPEPAPCPECPQCPEPAPCPECPEPEPKHKSCIKDSLA